MTKAFLDKTVVLIAFLSVLFVVPGYSASKKKTKSKEKTETVQQESENSDVQDLSDSIKLPAQKRTYFYKIDKEIISEIEDGSPDSIRSAFSKLRKPAADYEEYEKILMAVAAGIMKLVWPSEKFTWEVPVVTEPNPYTGALTSVEQGVFDSSTGNVDFLSTLLPALVLVKPITDESVLYSCENSLKTVFNARPDSVLTNYLFALLCEKQGEYKTAESYITKAFDKAPRNEEISLAYIRVLRRVGKLDQAYEVLSRLENNTTDINLLKQNAYIAFESCRLSDAELYVAKVLQQNPNDLEFVLLRSKILIEKNDYIHAVSLLDMYARQDNSSIEYLILRAKVQLDWSKNTVAATETVEKAMELYPDNIDALMFAARISSVTDSPVGGKYADELAAKVLEKLPGDKEAMTYALKGLIQRENWQEAYNIAKIIVSQPVADTSLIEMYVEICVKLGKNSEAYDFAKKQLELNPGDETVMQAYVLAYSQTGSRDMVLKYIDSLMKSSSAKMKSYLYFRRSFLQLTEENTLADLRSSLISNPRNSDALFRLYEMYYDKKDYRKAQYYLRQVVAINPNDNSVKQLNEALTKLIQ